MLAFTSLSAARLGISGIVLLISFAILSHVAISLLSRHHSGATTNAGVAGFIVLTCLACWIATTVNTTSTKLPTLFLIGGVTSFVASAPLLELPILQRTILTILIPSLYLLSDGIGEATHQYVVDNILK